MGWHLYLLGMCHAHDQGKKKPLLRLYVGVDAWSGREEAGRKIDSGIVVEVIEGWVARSIYDYERNCF